MERFGPTWNSNVKISKYQALNDGWNTKMTEKNKSMPVAFAYNKKLSVKLAAVKRILINIACFLIPVFGIFLIGKKKGDSVGEKIINSLIYILFWLYSASLTFFIVWSFYSSFKLAFPTKA